jgi:hypothetical protein
MGVEHFEGVSYFFPVGGEGNIGILRRVWILLQLVAEAVEASH